MAYSRFQRILVVYGIPLATFLAFVMLSSVERFFHWHLLHGFHVEAGEVRFRVPLFYRVDHSSKSSFTMVAVPGLVPENPKHLRHGTITVSIGPARESRSPSTDSPPVIQLVRSLDGIEFARTGEPTLTLAGREGKCIEEGGFTRPDDVRWYGEKTVKIFCRFGDDAVASFLGSAASANDFYDIIKSAHKFEGAR
jgi:hypothetical protein